MVLLSTQIICFGWEIRKYLQFYADFFLSKPVDCTYHFYERLQWLYKADENYWQKGWLVSIAKGSNSNYQCVSVDCDPGEKLDGTSCSPCDDGDYQPDRGTGACQECPEETPFSTDDRQGCKSKYYYVTN